MGYRSDVTIDYVPKRRHKDKFAHALKLYVDETYPTSSRCIGRDAR